MVKTLYSILHRSLDLTEFMEEVLIDDNMVFDIDNLKGFLNDTSSFGFIAKENNKIIPTKRETKMPQIHGCLS